MAFTDTKYWLENIRNKVHLYEDIRKYADIEYDKYNLEQTMLREIKNLEDDLNYYEEHALMGNFAAADLKIRIIKSILNVKWEDDETFRLAKWLYKGGEIRTSQEIDDVINFLYWKENELQCDKDVLDYSRTTEGKNLDKVGSAVLLVSALSFLLWDKEPVLIPFSIIGIILGIVLEKNNSKIMEHAATNRTRYPCPGVPKGFDYKKAFALASLFTITTGLITGIREKSSIDEV